ncbi:DNA-binding transcriptional regulator, IscR family [Acetitomaculum ruminis DSM 5522]|uniref:DNA-binding transcriptional regulator, IscR family n=1 Tax=Acetitomaculum ruminis DSM 5522 TaxID=1120918 RepID=A0A1I0YV29_9FIRM|nr:Rrf2 family transcriptional regulator [Acetitomaculum ruminis]SFB17062.1 DNA-binding transcriptional regulator, IscR family [Acetitomaculum ruminis DSM 5522]
MQISTKFTTAMHVLIAVKFFSGKKKITSDFLAGSTGSNPVIIRNIMGQLKAAGFIDIKRGPGGIKLQKELDEITFLDLYKAVENNTEDNIFRFHEISNPVCPIGKNIHKVLESSLHDIQDKFEAELDKHYISEIYEKTVKAIKLAV